MSPDLVLSALDTVQCAYFFSTGLATGIDFGDLLLQREVLRHAKVRDPKLVNLGGIEFLLQAHASSPGPVCR